MLTIPQSVKDNLMHLSVQEINRFWEYLENTPNYKIQSDFEVLVEGISIEKASQFKSLATQL